MVDQLTPEELSIQGFRELLENALKDVTRLSARMPGHLWTELENLRKRSGNLTSRLRKELADAQGRVAVLEEALRPFAKMADEVDEWSKGTGQFTGAFDANDLRRARAALWVGEK